MVGGREGGREGERGYFRMIISNGLALLVSGLPSKPS